jgi:AcrR family transcriptional regulator
MDKPDRDDDAMNGRVAVRPRPRVRSHDDAVRTGCAHFHRHGTLDMDRLADEMAISRATLYRIVSGREYLLAEVLWRLADEALADASRERDGILGVLWAFLDRIEACEPFTHFAGRESALVMRLLWSPSAPFSRRALFRVEQLLIDTIDAVDAPTRERTRSAAFLILHLLQALCLSQALTGQPADRSLAGEAIRYLVDDVRPL